MERETINDIYDDLNTTLEFFIRGSYMQYADTKDTARKILVFRDLGEMGPLKFFLEDIVDDQQDVEDDPVYVSTLINELIKEAEEAIKSPDLAPLCLSRAMSQCDGRVEILVDSMKTFRERLLQVIPNAPVSPQPPHQPYK
ncbi:hypothetical protein ACFLZH_00530 [Patescibacteria group bacterium]